MISYAQNFEDVMLNRIFRDQPTGFYVDAGAGDPLTNSVTKWFYDHGWSGINIEPHPEFFKALLRDRPRDVNLNCGAAAANGEAAFIEMPTREWSSFDAAVRQRALERGDAIVERRTRILTLNEIIERHGGGRAIDFLKIDVEGWERQVLSGLDLSRHQPTIVLVEATRQGTAEPTYAEWEEILISAGYLSVYFDGLNKFYLRRERIDLTKHFAVPPNVFDEFTHYDNVILHNLLKEAEADRAARLQQIRELTKRLEKRNPVVRWLSHRPFVRSRLL